MSNAATSRPCTVTVIVPVYNSAAYLSDCVESVLSQTHEDLEIILVNDGSTDGSGDLCDAYAVRDGRVRVVHQDNAGVSAARNSGIRVANGAYVMFVDSDDWISSDCVESLIHAAERGGAKAAVCSARNAAAVSETCDPGSPPANPTIMSSEEFFRDTASLRAIVKVTCWGKLFAKSLLKDFAFPEGRLHEDVHVVHKALQAAGRLAIDPRPLYYYRQRSGSLTQVHQMSLRSACDKARAHLERAKDMITYGLHDVAIRDLRTGLAWHSRCADVARRKPKIVTAPIFRELQQQRSLLSNLGSAISLGYKIRAVLKLHLWWPEGAASLFGPLFATRSKTPPIEGERASSRSLK